MVFEIKFKVWIEKDGEVVFSSAREELLKEIDREGSINKAAKKLGISYKKAWLLIKHMEERLGYPILEKKRGGVSGGGSKLTDAGKELLKLYEEIINECSKIKKYNHYFEEKV